MTTTETTTANEFEAEPVAYVTTRDLDDRLYEIDETLRAIYSAHRHDVAGFIRGLRNNGYRMSEPSPRLARKATESVKYSDYSAWLYTVEAPLKVRLEDGSTQTTWLECGKLEAEGTLPAFDEAVLDAWERLNPPREDKKPLRFWLYMQVSRRRSRSYLRRDNIRLVRGRRSLLGRSRRIAELA